MASTPGQCPGGANAQVRANAQVGAKGFDTEWWIVSTGGNFVHTRPSLNQKSINEGRMPPPPAYDHARATWYIVPRLWWGNALGF